MSMVCIHSTYSDNSLQPSVMMVLRLELVTAAHGRSQTPCCTVRKHGVHEATRDEVYQR